MSNRSRPLARAACAALVAAALWPAAPAFALDAPPAPAAEAEPAPGPPDVLGDQPEVDPSAFTIRHHQLGLHQGFGLATLAAMAVTGGLGYWTSEFEGPAELRDLHLAAAGLTTGLYLTTGTLALATPPNPLAHQRAAWDTVGLHEKGAWLHAAGMLGTVGLGLATVYGGSDFKPYHGVAAAATFGLMALSAGVIAFGE